MSVTFLTNEDKVELQQGIEKKASKATTLAGYGITDGATKDEVSQLQEQKVDKEEVTLGIHTDGLIYLFVDGLPKGSGIAQGTQAPSGDVVGYVDSGNNIVLTGNLDEGGIYTLKYEMEDGTIIDIGELKFSSNNNLILSSVDTAGNPFGTNGIMYGYRWNSSGATSTSDETNCTGLMEVKAGDIVYLEKSGIYTDTTTSNGTRFVFFDTNRGYKSYYQPWDSSKTTSEITGIVTNSNEEITQFTVVNDGYIAIAGFNQNFVSTMGKSSYLGADSIITKNERIV